MNGFLEFVTVFCSGAMLFGGVFILKPSGNTVKAVKYVFALVFLCIVISALFKIKISDDFINTNNTYKSVDTDVLREDIIKQTFEQTLKSQNINFNQITVCTNKTENGSITISKVIVFSGDSAEKIIAALGGNNAEYEIEVIYE